MYNVWTKPKLTCGSRCNFCPGKPKASASCGTCGTDESVKSIIQANYSDTQGDHLSHEKQSYAMN